MSLGERSGGRSAALGWAAFGFAALAIRFAIGDVESGSIATAPIDWILVGVMVALAVASAAASVLLAPKPETAGLGGDEKTTLSERGSFVPRVWGPRAVGPVFAWAGDRSSVSGSVVNYREAGWHLLAVGPASRLVAIRDGGTEIWRGPIEASTTPSGTKISTSKGDFRVFWGDGAQPINSELGLAKKVGIASRWPWICYVEWDKKKLGPAPLWGQIQYEIEVRPFASPLVKSSPYYPGTLELFGSVYSVVAVANGVPGLASITILGSVTKTFPSGTSFRYSGSTAAGTYVVASATKVSLPVFDPGLGAVVVKACTRLNLLGGLFGAIAAGEVQAFQEKPDSGANAAHVLAELLFSAYPHGVGEDPDDWDLGSLEDLGALLESEGIRSSIVAGGGESARQVVARVLLDVGCYVATGTDGRSRFVPIRPVADPNAIATIPLAAKQRPLPERNSVLAGGIPDRIIYEFSDRELWYRSNPLTADDDGSQVETRSPKSTRVTLSTVVDRGSAEKVRERRLREGIQGAASIQVAAGRAARRLVAGALAVVEGVPGLWRVGALSFDSDSSRTRLELFADDVATGPPAPDPIVLPPAPGPPLAPQADLLVGAVEIPGYLASETSFFFPRVRAHSQVDGASLWLSSNGTSFEEVVQLDLPPTAGGRLKDPLPAALAGPGVSEALVVGLGPDWGALPDLTGNDAEWRAGALWVAIGSGAGLEIAFARRAVALGAGIYRLEGLIRGRLGTPPVAQGSGLPVFVFRPGDLPRVSSPLLSPGVLAYAKAVPSVKGDQVPFPEVEALSFVSIGFPLVAQRPANLAVSPHSSPVYKAGQGVALRWSYRSLLSTTSGAGLQGAGTATTPAPVDGTFSLRLWTTGGSPQLKKTLSGIATNARTISSAEIISAFGSEPATFRIELLAKKGSTTAPSPVVDLVLTKV